MAEIEHYDRAANRFYSALNIFSLPLVSWDFYASHHHRVCRESADVGHLKKLAQINKWASPVEFDKRLLDDKYVIVVTDSQLKIVHATRNMLEMNGYLPHEVIGKRPKMFQGKNTCKETSKKIGNAIKKHKVFEAVLLNYRKDGSTYKCWIKGEPIHNTSGEVVNFIAYEKEVA